MNINKKAIGDRLREVRTKFGFTQDQVANALHIDRSTYTYYELGKTSPDVPTLMMLAQQVYGMKEWSDLLSLDDFNSPSLLRDSSDHPKIKSGRKRKREISTTNTSKIYNLPNDEQQLILYYRVMTPEQKEALLLSAEQTTAQNAKKARNLDNS